MLFLLVLVLSQGVKHEYSVSYKEAIKVLNGGKVCESFIVLSSYNKIIGTDCTYQNKFISRIEITYDDIVLFDTLENDQQKMILTKEDKLKFGAYVQLIITELEKNPKDNVKTYENKVNR
jgi:hypothetical protein